jgi:hypothetical protein
MAKAKGPAGKDVSAKSIKVSITTDNGYKSSHTVYGGNFSNYDKLLDAESENAAFFAKSHRAEKAVVKAGGFQRTFYAKNQGGRY